jgi:hypothetical protein
VWTVEKSAMGTGSPVSATDVQDEVRRGQGWAGTRQIQQRSWSPGKAKASGMNPRTPNRKPRMDLATLGLWGPLPFPGRPSRWGAA